MNLSQWRYRMCPGGLIIKKAPHNFECLWGLARIAIDFSGTYSRTVFDLFENDPFARVFLCRMERQNSDFVDGRLPRCTLRPVNAPFRAIQVHFETVLLSYGIWMRAN